MDTYDDYRLALKKSILKRDSSEHNLVDLFHFSKSISTYDDSKESRVVPFVASDSKVDRYGDVIHNDGMNLDNFLAGGSILYGHLSTPPELVMGKPKEAVKVDGSTIIDVEFVPKGINPTADMVFSMVVNGFIRGSSVGILIGRAIEADRPGFMPLDIVSSELLELSITPVPVNPRALAVLVSEDEEAKRSFEFGADTGDETAQEVMTQNQKVYSVPSREVLTASLWREINKAWQSNQ